ncbi:hypothetical protein IMCC21224_11652 [Puniceibacterium sp. IMCC21224]|nr:hypothetical protein IMCC21224_11652 [Puniceibacterium sp. IMCC21224]
MRMSTVQKEYEARVASGALARDPAQEAALPAFERIRSALAQPVKKGLFRKAPPPPRGFTFGGGSGAASRC